MARQISHFYIPKFNSYLKEKHLCNSLSCCLKKSLGFSTHRTLNIMKQELLACTWKNNSQTMIFRHESWQIFPWKWMKWTSLQGKLTIFVGNEKICTFKQTAELWKSYIHIMSLRDSQYLILFWLQHCWY